MWIVYILVSKTITYTYVGCTINIQRRLRQHNGEIKGGAKRTRYGRPWILAKVYGPFDTRSEAQKIEYVIKKLHGKKRLAYKLNFENNSCILDKSR